MKLLKQAEYMAATGFTLHPTIAFRSGLGPYKAQRSPSFLVGVRAGVTGLALSRSFFRRCLDYFFVRD